MPVRLQAGLEAARRTLEYLSGGTLIVWGLFLLVMHIRLKDIPPYAWCQNFEWAVKYGAIMLGGLEVLFVWKLQSENRRRNIALGCAGMFLALLAGFHSQYPASPAQTFYGIFSTINFLLFFWPA